MRFAAFSSLILLAIFGCAAAGSSNEFGDTGGQGGDTGGTFATTGNSGTGGTVFTGSSSGAGAGGPGCSAAATYIYVLSDANVMYSFDPPAKKFTMIGPLSCPTTMQPNSMAVDRDAWAWVNYVEGGGFGDTAGQVFKVSTKDASCQPMAPIPLSNGWFRMGMGFSTDAVMGTSETLFVAGVDALGGGGTGLGRLDFNAMGVAPIGQFGSPFTGSNAELTGTGDARLFGFFTTTPVQVAEIDKTSGAILNAKALPTVETPFAWAFSFWGGDFYLYTAPDTLLNPTRTTNVTRYRPSDQTVDTAYMVNIGFRIVGAGVSTCAPLVPPK